MLVDRNSRIALYVSFVTLLMSLKFTEKWVVPPVLGRRRHLGGGSPDLLGPSGYSVCCWQRNEVIETASLARYPTAL